jgi:hypothetical protein
MQVIEQFSQGKTGDDSLNEDKVVVTEYFIAVLDGVTSRRGQMLQGMTNGRFAAHTIAAEIARMPRNINARGAVDHLTERLRTHSEQVAASENKAFGDSLRRPAAAMVMYSRLRREIWRVADPAFMIDGTVNEKTFPQEQNWCDLRRAYIHARLAKGETEDFLRDNDQTWELLSPMMAEFKNFTNYAGPFGYGVLNGAHVPDMHVEVYNADHAREIVLASDGYPRVFSTFEETERFLQYVVTEDPLMYRLYPQVKSVKKGYVSFDDRSYVRFLP